MERINKILIHLKYIDYLNRNFESEKTRVFCHHDLRHAIDVSRVAYILALEENLNIKKDLIYAAGLLHDIGRWQEYLTGMDHALISAQFAPEILKSCGFTPSEENIICCAIRNHRKERAQNMSLDRILYRSDKLSRPCNECLAIHQCKRFSPREKPKLHY
ncbi:HD domain-containing protein [Marinisporobacter balticus]|uniref:HD domain-containing protein n=1 Tax=Marinisporobacter balticus TaxID=2018667 RepID=A0A4R2L5F9_9FIRM|nr:HD domain-containing protein [Marinisporobacter balticus]TCO74395.1 uncharacterized protein EV214_11340 [Marinisporobacter balticus]